jgi:hypothetical protein
VQYDLKAGSYPGFPLLDPSMITGGVPSAKSITIGQSRGPGLGVGSGTSQPHFGSLTVFLVI